MLGPPCCSMVQAVGSIQVPLDSWLPCRSSLPTPLPRRSGWGSSAQLRCLLHPSPLLTTLALTACPSSPGPAGLSSASQLLPFVSGPPAALLPLSHPALVAQVAGASALGQPCPGPGWSFLYRHDVGTCPTMSPALVSAAGSASCSVISHPPTLQSWSCVALTLPVWGDR